MHPPLKEAANAQKKQERTYAVVGTHRKAPYRRGQLRPPPHGKEQRSCHLDAMLSLQDCSPFRKSADLSSQLCGNLCSATALLHVQPLGRMLSHRHVRAKSGEGCLLGLHDIGSASRMPVPPSTFHGGGVAVFLCSAQKAVSRLRCGLGGGDHLPSLPPLNTKGDDAADTEASELGSRASCFQKKRRRRPTGVDPPFWWVTP